jgi:hypothetical protein
MKKIKLSDFLSSKLELNESKEIRGGADTKSFGHETLKTKSDDDATSGDRDCGYADDLEILINP